MQFLLCCLLLLATVAAADNQVGPRKTPYARMPELAELMDWVTFAMTFDGERFAPEMAAGDAVNQRTSNAEFTRGVAGLAAVIGGGHGGAGLFARAGNFPVERQGAVSLWICPLEWNHTNDANVTFVTTSNAAFYVQRQGPLYKPDGQAQRHEALQFLCLSPQTGHTHVAQDCHGWKNGEWHLLVANWRWPQMEFSVDGGPFAAKAVVRMPAEDTFGNLCVGAQHGPRTLLDEVFIYRRPLSENEVKVIWETLRPRPETKEAQ